LGARVGFSIAMKSCDFANRAYRFERIAGQMRIGVGTVVRVNQTVNAVRTDEPSD
jgi:hypothetical protein